MLSESVNTIWNPPLLLFKPNESKSYQKCP